MLNTVPAQIAKAARIVTMRHPNAFDVVIYRKRILRLEPKTLGGLAVLADEDESDVDWDLLGEGKLLFSDQYAGSNWSSDQDNINYSASGFFAQIEPLDDAIQLQKTDIVYLLPGGGAAIAYEITNIPSTIGIPGYTRKFEIQKRDDLMFIPEFQK
jgi:hypothetical protein